MFSTFQIALEQHDARNKKKHQFFTDQKMHFL